jgi:hypothetical protein
VSTPPRGDRRLELASAILLACAAVATAWAAYQSRQWTGEQSQGYSKATAARIAENRFAALASRQVQIDVATFIQWVNAHQEGRPALAGFYRARFRDEFRPALAAWLATRPFGNPHAPATPFAMPQYHLTATAKSQALELRAAAVSQRAKDANARADDYMLAVVLFASALFFGGVSTKLSTRSARLLTLGLGWALLVGTLIFLATLPVHLTT